MKLDKMNKEILKVPASLIVVSLILSCAIYIMNVWFLPSTPLAKFFVRQTDALFIEGLLFLIAGITFFIGSGGLSRASQSAALLASAAKGISDDAIGPSEIFKRDAWKPRGFTRFGLILIMTGIILLIISFIPI